MNKKIFSSAIALTLLFIECYKGSKQENETSKKAVEFLKTTKEYEQSQKYSLIPYLKTQNNSVEILQKLLQF